MIAELNERVDLGSFGESINKWVNIEADLILYVFLPPLLFGEAMNLNWYQVKGGFAQSLTLAGPGVIVGAFVMGFIVKFIMPFGWSWNLSMVFGSILSATDPVAVVALLKDAGASSKLTILIIGESLMNDGTAMVYYCLILTSLFLKMYSKLIFKVLFTLFYNMLHGDVYNFAGIVIFFLKMALGSPLLGMAFGILAVRWLRIVNRPLVGEDTTIQIAITLCCAYLSFYTSQV